MRRVRLILIVIAVAWLLTGLTQVRPGERGVVRRFGRVIATPTAGLWVGLPWGIESVERVRVDWVRRVTVGYQSEIDETDDAAPPGQLLTGDQNLVNVQAVVDYAVRADAVAEYAAVKDRVDGAIARAAEAALSEWVAGRGVDDVLLTGKAALPLWLSARLRERLEPYQLGIDVQTAGVTHLAPPKNVNFAFVAVTSAQAGIRTREQEAGRDANERLRLAATKADELTQSSAAVAHESIARAEADAAGFRQRLMQYQRVRRANPEILAAMWWDELGPMFTKLRSAGRLDLLDAHLGPDGLDIMQVGPRTKPP
jgi:modulator of FtsH protease HflK